MSFQGALARLPQEEILVAENVFQSNDNQEERPHSKPSSAFKASNSHCKHCLFRVASPDGPLTLTTRWDFPLHLDIIPRQGAGGKW